MSIIEHEDGNINDKYLRYFMANQHFHDSIIKEVHLSEIKRNLKLVIFCHREWMDDCGLQDGYDMGNPEQSSHISRKSDPKYVYRAEFYDYEYLAMETDDPQDSLQVTATCFKQTARLEQLNRRTQKRYYHLRIIVNSDNYIDVIFSRFGIEKPAGKIAVPARVPQLRPFDHIMKLMQDKKLSIIRKQSKEGNWLDKRRSMIYLALNKKNGAKEAALSGLSSEDEEVIEAAVFALGLCGNIGDLPRLWNILSRKHCVNPLLRRNIMDSAEKILLRSKFAVKE